MKRLLSVVLLLALSFTVYAEETSDIIAEFDGGTLTFAEIMEQYSVYEELYIAIYGEEPDAESAHEMQISIAESLAEQKAIDAYLAGLGVTLVSDAEYAEAIAYANSTYEDMLNYSIEWYVQAGYDADEAAQISEAELLESGMSLDDLISDYTSSVKANAEMIYLAGEVTISEDEVRENYDSRVADDMLYCTEAPAEYEQYMLYFDGDVYYLSEPVRRILMVYDDIAAEQTLLVSENTTLLAEDMTSALFTLALGESVHLDTDEFGGITCTYIGDEPQGAIAYESVYDEIYADLYSAKQYEQYTDACSRIIEDCGITYYFYRLG